MSQTQVSTQNYYNFLEQQGCNFFIGVPDSLLKSFCACAKDLAPAGQFAIAANEGTAVGMAIGAYLANGNIPLVYLQNSGLGNTLNPLASMADPMVYSIPLLLLVGWRGELGQGQQQTGSQRKDEPQHRHQGRITLAWLQTCDIPYEILPCEDTAAQQVTANLLQRAKSEQRPVALVVRKNTFSSYSAGSTPISQPTLQLGREQVIRFLLDQLPAGPIVSTTGMVSRELFEQRAQRSQTHEQDFLVVGAMGHASSIAQGLAQQLKQQNREALVYCFDGDGALLMHMGSLAIIGQSTQLGNFKHILLNNGAHDSVGGQPTVALELDIPTIAKSCGYHWAQTAKTHTELEKLLPQLLRATGPAMLEIIVKKGARNDLGRPTLSLQEIKAGFKSYLAHL